MENSLGVPQPGARAPLCSWREYHATKNHLLLAIQLAPPTRAWVELGRRLARARLCARRREAGPSVLVADLVVGAIVFFVHVGAAASFRQIVPNARGLRVV